MELTDPGLETDRFRLLPLSEAYRDVIEAAGALDAMWRSFPAVKNGTGYQFYFDHCLKKSDAGELPSFMIHDKMDNDRFIGCCAFIKPNRTHRRVQIGYMWLAEDRRGQGIYAHIQKLMIQRALDWGARRISWLVEARNEIAIGAISSLGAENEGTLRSHSKFADGMWLDVTILSMLRDEAKEAVRRLDVKLSKQEA